MLTSETKSKMGNISVRLNEKRMGESGQTRKTQYGAFKKLLNFMPMSSSLNGTSLP